MRTLNGQETAVINAPDGYSVRARVWVWNGTAYQDVTSLEGRDWLVEVSWDESVDSPCAQATVQLRRRQEDLSLNPLVSNKLTGTLALTRAFYIETATVPLGDAPESSDWREVFRGQIERLSLDKDPITFVGRDDAGKLLRHFIEFEAQYGSTSGVAVETVMQQILTDNGWGVTLYVPATPGSPGVVLGKYKQRKMSTFLALRERALAIGWDVRMWWDSGTSAFRLTLLRPDRTGTAGSKWTFQPGQVRAVTRLEQDISEVRNAGRLYYYNRSATDSGKKPTRTYVDSSDATSIATYGRLWMQLSEDEDSPVDSPTEAQAMLDSAVADLKNPLLDFGVEVGFHYGIQLGDLLTFAADDDHFSSDQTLAVVSAAHRIRRKVHRTSLTLRGLPVGAHDDWLRRESRAEEQPPAAVPDTITGLAASTTQGGAVITFTAPTVPPFPDEYELHISTSTGFTPSSTTLWERANRTTFTPPGLTPGTTYYAKVVPRHGNNLGTASAEVSFTPRYLEPRALQPQIAFGALPPNGDFEALNGGTSESPDGWDVDGGTWSTDIQTDSTTYAGARSIRFLPNVLATTYIRSQYMVVRPNTRYVVEVVGKASGTTAPVAIVNVQFFATVGASPVSSQSLTDTARPLVNTDWTTYQYVVTSPATAKYARIRLSRSVTTDSVYFDSVDWSRGSLVQEDWTLVGAAPDPTYDVAYENGWTTWGGAFGQVAFRINSLGNLEFRGLAKAPTPAPAGYATIFTLPSGYRPSARRLVRLNVPTTGATDLEIWTDGSVKIQAIAAGTYLSLDDIAVPLT